MKLILTKESNSNQLKRYFELILELSKTGDEFPVDLDNVYALIYSRKDSAVRELRQQFIECIDYQIIHENAKNLNGGRPVIKYYLTCSCLEYFIARKVRAVFDIYRNVFHKSINRYEIPQTLSEALMLAANQAEKIELQEKALKEAKPKIENYDIFIDSSSIQGFKEVANMLGYGRNKFISKLRDLKILTSKNIPYQRFLEAKYFEVKESTQNGFNTATTYVTPKGINYITNKLKS